MEGKAAIKHSISWFLNLDFEQANPKLKFSFLFEKFREGHSDVLLISIQLHKPSVSSLSQTDQKQFFGISKQMVNFFNTSGKRYISVPVVKDTKLVKLFPQNLGDYQNVFCEMGLLVFILASCIFGLGTHPLIPFL